MAAAQYHRWWVKYIEQEEGSGRLENEEYRPVGTVREPTVGVRVCMCADGTNIRFRGTNASDGAVVPVGGIQLG